MRIKAVAIFLPMFLLIVTSVAHASTGFLGGPMWISPEAPSDGQLVNLSALFHNAEPNELTGDVVFYDGDVLLGRKTISISSGGVATATVSFRVGAGDHLFSATIGNLFESTGGSQSEPFALSPETVQLPKISVSPKAGNELQASVVSSVGEQNDLSPNSPIAPVVAQVNKLQGNVIASIPDSIKNPVSTVAENIDTYRAENAGVFDKATKSSSDTVKSINALAAAQQKQYGKVPLSTTMVDRPFAYLKLFFFTLMTFLYSHELVFYGTIIFLLYIVGRFIIRRVITMRSRKKPSKPRPKTYSKYQKMQE